MTKTSDERREAAERLRDWRPTQPGEAPSLVNAMQSLGRAAGAMPGEVITERLAGLVDPTCEMVGSPEACVTCSACGAALVQPRYATFEGGHAVLRDLAYCPACGARVIGRGVE